METRQSKQISLAQNFLRSPKLVSRLVRVSKIGLSDTVYEIGPGNGIITAALASVAGQVIAIEKDPELARRLRERFRSVENVEIVQQDFLDYSFRFRANIGVRPVRRRRPTALSEYKMFANIPYNRTTQIVRRILCRRSPICEAHLVIQKEAANRFSGYPRETLFSILTKPFYDFQVLWRLKRSDFWPVPSVDSVLLSIKRRDNPLIEVQNVSLYREFVQYGFGRWKPNLKLAFKDFFTYKQWKRLARDLDFPLNATPTELSVKQWIGLYRVFQAHTLDRPRRG